MNSKLRKEIASAYKNTDTVAMAVLCIVIMWKNLIAGIICLLLVGGLWAYNTYVQEKKIYRKLTEYKDSVLKDREDLMDSFSNESPLLLCVIDKHYHIHWTNSSFEHMFGSITDLDRIISKDELKSLFDHEKDTITISVNESCFRISDAPLSSGGGNFKLLFWEDVGEATELRKKYSDSRVCVAYVNVDNLDEIIQDTPIESRSRIAAQIDELVFAWARTLDAAAYSVSDSRYALIFREKHLQALRNNGFAVLNEMHKIEISADFPASLSIGIGAGEAELPEIQQSASEAIELALGRGGDQAVIRTKDGDTEYFGGSLPTVEKRNKGKSRVMAHALLNLINDADRVFIVGHTRADMDSIGASLGIYAIASNSKKPVCIVLEDPGDAIDAIYRNALALKNDDGSPAYVFVSHEEARAQFTSKSLLVMVDHHRAVISEDPGLVKIAGKIAVIDHHRKSGDAVEQTVLSFMESYASSASELVTEILQYCGDRGDISRFEAEGLLSGINLDTKNFTINTGVRTFDAAAWLKRNGADSATIRTYFKTDLNFYQKKINVIANAEVLSNGIAVAYTKDIDPSMQLIVSQAADELLMMKGVEAAIAAGRNGSATMVSARSNGKYNVQTLMEKLGGGGHQTVAAAQLEVGPEEAISQVVQAMRLEGIL